MDTDSNVLLWVFTHWEPISAIIILLLLSYVVIFFLQIKKSKATLIVAITLGLIVGLTYFILTTNLEPGISENQIMVESINTWLSLVWNIFMILLLVVLPIYIFSMVSTTFINTRHHEKGRKLLFLSFLSLLGMTLLGIVIALSFIPLFLILKDYMQLDSLSTIDSNTESGILGGALQGFLLNYGLLVIISIVLAITFGVTMNVLHKYKHDFGEKTIEVIVKIRESVKIYLSWVSKLIPYVLVGMLILLLNNYENIFTNTMQSLALFTIFFFLGLIIVWSIEYFIVNVFRDKTLHDKKEFSKITRQYIINDFSVQSAPVLFPITVQYTKDLGVEKDVYETTPVLSSFMGYSMCGGFYPALIVIFTLIQDKPFLNPEVTYSLMIFIILILIMVPLILVTSLGMTGVPGADVAIILGIISTLGLSPYYFHTIYLLEPLFDKFRGVGNSMGFAASSVITNKLYKRSLSEKENLNKKIK